MTHISSSNWLADYSAIIEAGTAKSTRRAYSRDVAYFWTWSQLAHGQVTTYPASVDSVIRFILDHVGSMDPVVEEQLITDGWKRYPGPLKIPTLRRYLASLSIAHQEAGVDSPTLHPKVKILLRRARRAQSDNRPN